MPQHKKFVFVVLILIFTVVGASVVAAIIISFTVPFVEDPKFCTEEKCFFVQIAKGPAPASLVMTPRLEPLLIMFFITFLVSGLFWGSIQECVERWLN